MSNFEIITITLSFIVGLGVAQLLNSVGAAIRERHEHPLHWMPFAWGAVILLFSVQYWFGLFDLNRAIGDWDWFWYGQMLALAIVLFLAGALVLPPRASITKGGLQEDFVTHGRLSLLAVVIYCLGWIPANIRLNEGSLFFEGNIINVTMAIVAWITFKATSNRVRLASTAIFYFIFLYALLAFYSTPGSQPPPLDKLWIFD